MMWHSSSFIITKCCLEQPMHNDQKSDWCHGPLHGCLRKMDLYKVMETIEWQYKASHAARLVIENHFWKTETWIKSVTSCSIWDEKAVCGGQMKKKIIFWSFILLCSCTLVFQQLSTFTRRCNKISKQPGFQIFKFRSFFSWC
jgi:hypothetical protein